MSIEDKDKIDSIGIDSGFGNVILGIDDDLAWRNEQEHLKELSEKINSYLALLENGELFKRYPEAEGKRVEILITFKNGITLKGQEFIKLVRNKLIILGINVSYKITD